MADSPEDLERRIDELRAAVRRAASAGDRLTARDLRAQLRDAQNAWDDVMAELELAAAALRPESAAPSATTVPATTVPATTVPATTVPATAAQSAEVLSTAVPSTEVPSTAVPCTAVPSTAGSPQTPPAAGPLLPVREQVHQALTLLGVASSPRLIVAVHDAFFSGPLVAARLTSMRRDEERSFRSAPYARAYYLCAALTADLLGPARGLLAVSTWPLERRVIGPLSPRVDFLTAAVAVAGHVQRARGPGADADRLLRRFAVSIPGAETGGRRPDPGTVTAAALAELEVHIDRDRTQRQAAAKRARTQLDDAGQLFGSRLRPAGRAAAGS